MDLSTVFALSSHRIRTDPKLEEDIRRHRFAIREHDGPEAWRFRTERELAGISGRLGVTRGPSAARTQLRTRIGSYVGGTGGSGSGSGGPA